MKLFSPWAAGLLFCACFLVACEKSSVPASAPPASVPSASFPLVITDGAGRTVTLEAAPQRIVSLSPAATEMLYAIHAQAQLAGVTRYCKLQPEDEKRVARVGGVMDPDYERLASLHPDLVIAPFLADKTLQEKLQSLGLVVVVMHPEGLAGILDDVRMIGQATGHENDGQNAAGNIEGLCALIAGRIKDVSVEKRPRVLLQMDDLSPAPGSYVDDLLTAAGGRNVLPRGSKSWVAISPESLLQLNPEVVIEIPPEAGTVPANPATTDATKQIFPPKARIVMEKQTEGFYHPDTTVAKALWELARDLYPERFPEVSPPIPLSASNP
jgi:iron complex transport system substrate-binding protein